MFIAIVLFAAAPGLEAPAGWGSLQPGPHAVGFRSEWLLDHARKYDFAFEKGGRHSSAKSPRPVLLNCWYPATLSPDSKPMPHRGYFEIESNNPSLKAFSQELAAYNRSVVAVEMFGKKPGELSREESAELDRHFDAPTASRRHAPKAEGRFPLAIYHSGAASSFEDNAVLCEYLASNGWVVIGSAFQDEFGRSLNTDNRQGSAADLAFLISHARSMEGVDWRRVAVIGHSAGAQAAISYVAQSNAAVDAVVSLDTTQDYHGLLHPGWDFARKAVENAKNVTCTLMMAAGPTAFFEMADALEHSDRYYLTIGSLDHNDFIAQGIAAREARVRLAADGTPEKKTAMAELDAARMGYAALCESILDFLTFSLNGDRAAQLRLEALEAVPAGGGAPRIEFMPKGRKGPQPYSAKEEFPPTPRQVRPFLAQHGREALIGRLERFRVKSPSHPIFDRQFQINLVGDLLDQGKRDHAVALSRHFQSHGVDCVKNLLQVAALYERIGHRKGATRYWERVLTLDQANHEARRKIDAMQPQAAGEKRMTDTQRPVETGHAPVNGIQMYYEVHGRSNGVPLVLLHGGGSTIDVTFGRVIPHLSAKRRIIAVEEQGHGRTTDRDAPAAFETSADDVAALLRHLKIKKADLFGFSNGASVALHTAIRHPTLVRRLVFASSFTKKSGAQPQLWEFMKQADVSNMPQALKDAFLKVTPDEQRLKTMHDKDAARMNGFKDVPDELMQAVKAPTLIVLGDQDIVKIEHAVEMTRLIPGSRLLILLGGHGDYLGEAVTTQKADRRPELTAGLVEEFLAHE